MNKKMKTKLIKIFCNYIIVIIFICSGNKKNPNTFKISNEKKREERRREKVASNNTTTTTTKHKLNKLKNSKMLVFRLF